MIKVFADKNVPKKYKNIIRHFIPYIKFYIPITHYIPLYLVHCESIEVEGTKKKAQAIFGLHEETNKPIMVIATKIGRPSWDKYCHLLEALVHECVHYEQFRKGASINERGVQRRTHRLCNNIIKDIMEKNN